MTSPKRCPDCGHLKRETKTLRAQLHRKQQDRNWWKRAAETALETTADKEKEMNDRDTFEFQFSENETPNIEGAVFQALGAASTCWDSMEGTGVFHSDRAKEIGEALIGFISSTPDLLQTHHDLREAASRVPWPPPRPRETMRRVVLPTGEKALEIVSECTHAFLLQTTGGYRIVEPDIFGDSAIIGPLFQIGKGEDLEDIGCVCSVGQAIQSHQTECQRIYVLHPTEERA